MNFCSKNQLLFFRKLMVLYDFIPGAAHHAPRTRKRSASSSRAPSPFSALTRRFGTKFAIDAPPPRRHIFLPNIPRAIPQTFLQLRLYNL